MLRKLGLCLIAAALAVAGLRSTPAFADGWGNVDCEQNPYPGCDLGVGSQARPERPAPYRPNLGSPDHAGSGGGGNPAATDPARLRCSYVRSDYQPPAADGSVRTAAYEARPLQTGALTVIPVAATSGSAAPGGAWYVYQCTGNGVRDALYRAPVWIPDRPAARGVAAADPAALARQAYQQLRLPAPVIGVSPSGAQLVNLPTWLWLERRGWGPRSATAAAPGVSVTATATPSSVSWSMGDSHVVTCPGPGTPYTAGADPAAGSPDCGYTYRRSSAGQPGEAFAVTATVHWTVVWSGAGRSGSFAGLTTTARIALRVAESQALNSR
jgi:hypothetical protein